MLLQTVVLKTIFVSVILCTLINVSAGTPIQRNGPKKKKMTQESHPMLASIFSTANNVKMIDFTNKHVGVKRSGNVVKQGEVPVASVSKRFHRKGPNSFLEIAVENRIKKVTKGKIKDIDVTPDSSKSIIAGTANAICQYCRTIQNVTCIQIYCFNDAATTASLFLGPNVPRNIPQDTLQITKSENLPPQELERPISFGVPTLASDVGKLNVETPITSLHDVSSKNIRNILATGSRERNVPRAPISSGQVSDNFPNGFDLNHVEFVPLSELGNALPARGNTELQIHHAVPIFQSDNTQAMQSEPHVPDHIPTIVIESLTPVQTSKDTVKPLAPIDQPHVVQGHAVSVVPHEHLHQPGPAKNLPRATDRHPQDMARVAHESHNPLPEIPMAQQPLPLSEIVVFDGTSSTGIINAADPTLDTLNTNDGSLKSLFELPPLEIPISNTAPGHHSINPAVHTANNKHGLEHTMIGLPGKGHEPHLKSKISEHPHLQSGNEGPQSTNIISTGNEFAPHPESNTMHSNLNSENTGSHITDIRPVRPSSNGLEQTPESIPVELTPNSHAHSALDQLPPLDLIELDALLPVETQPKTGEVNARPSDMLFESPIPIQINNEDVVVPGARPFNNFNPLTGNEKQGPDPQLPITQVVVPNISQDTASSQDLTLPTNRLARRRNMVQIPSAQTFQVLKPHLDNPRNSTTSSGNTVQIPSAQTFQVLKPHLDNQRIPTTSSESTVQIPSAQTFRVLKPHLGNPHNPNANSEAVNNAAFHRQPRTIQIAEENANFVNVPSAQGFSEHKPHLQKRQTGANNERSSGGLNQNRFWIAPAQGFQAVKPRTRQSKTLNTNSRGLIKGQNTQSADAGVIKTLNGQFVNENGGLMQSFSELYSRVPGRRVRLNKVSEPKSQPEQTHTDTSIGIVGRLPSNTVNNQRINQMKTANGQFMNGHGKQIKSFSELYGIRPRTKKTNSKKVDTSLGGMELIRRNGWRIGSTTLAPSTVTMVTMSPVRKAQLKGMSKTYLSSFVPSF